MLAGGHHQVMGLHLKATLVILAAVSKLTLLLTLPLGGCWFFMVPIPSSMTQDGNACAGDGVYVGQKLRNAEGKVGKVEKVIGRHQRCQEAVRPVLVQVSYD